MLRSSLCDYSDAYILVKGTITVANTADQDADQNDGNIMNNMQVDDAHGIDVVKPMYNLLEYCDKHSKTSGLLQQYCKDENALDDNDDIADFTVANSITDSFKIKEKIPGQTDNNGTKNVEIMVPLKYISNFWRTF